MSGDLPPMVRYEGTWAPNGLWYVVAEGDPDHIERVFQQLVDLFGDVVAWYSGLNGPMPWRSEDSVTPRPLDSLGYQRLVVPAHRAMFLGVEVGGLGHAKAVKAVIDMLREDSEEDSDGPS